MPFDRYMSVLSWLDPLVWLPTAAGVAALARGGFSAFVAAKRQTTANGHLKTGAILYCGVER